MQNIKTGQAGTTALTDALGITGDPATIQAKLAATPGYQFALDQGTQNVLRNQAATGQLASGKTNLDLQNYGQGLANQTYQQYVQNLMPFLGFNQGAAAGAGGIYTGMGDALSNIYQGQGQAAYGADTSAANAQANADLAKNAGSANLWNMLLNVGKLGVGGSGGGGGTVGGNLISGAMNFLPAIFSDERLKEAIEPVGELYDGTGVYRYRYKGDDTPRIGLIAQEVEERNPDAVVDIGGFKAVRYDKATQYAANLARFLDAA